LVLAARPQGCIRQIRVEHQDRGHVSGIAGGSHFFLRRAAVSASLRREVIMATQLQQPGMELNLDATPLHHRRFEIVVVLWRAALCGRGG
jgi:hypothetical protein